MTSKGKQASACPCGSGRAAEHCCLPFIHGHALPATAEQLMRSRYTAYALHADDYVLATWHASTRPSQLHDEGPPPKWVALQVHSHAQHGNTATVCFTASCKISGRLTRMQENSRFVLEEGRWWYVDGTHAE